MGNIASELNEGRRFHFGANWDRFLSVIDADRIAAAEKSLREMLDVANLEGVRFLDAGSGSGLSSLVARRLGAAVHSFDFDPQSVACTQELRHRFSPDDPNWTIEEASVLDRDHLKRLGKFDVVYSWGVLHHTGAMWVGLDNLAALVKPGGLLFVAIYNDQGWKSHCWWLIKFIYNKIPRVVRPAYAYFLWGLAQFLNAIKYTVKLKPLVAISPLLDYKRGRGMSLTHDLVDWIGGFPYEFSTIEVLQQYIENRGFQLTQSKRATSLGCHEIVFKSVPPAPIAQN